jgi:hypothetical protein
MAHKLVIAAAAALALTSAAAGATETLTNQYTVSGVATHVSGNTYTFDYDVTNNNQYIGGNTGFDGFTIMVPDTAVYVSSTAPAPFYGAPGYWSQGTSNMLNLLGDGSQNITAPTGYHVYTWWGQDPSSVYPAGQTAHFSITLDNVSAGSNTVGASTYFAFGTPGGNQSYASNQWGNYTTFTADRASPMAAVPEPETYAMLIAGLGLLGFMARRRKA